MVPEVKEMAPCIREEHALWACRAVGLHCGRDLVKVRDCFRETGPANILRQPQTAYTSDEKEDKDSDELKGFPCRSQQRKLGSCVRIHAVDLEKRLHPGKYQSS